MYLLTSGNKPKINLSRKLRLAHDPRTKAYAARRTAEGKTKKEIIRCLKRYIAREIYKTLCRPKPPATASAPQVKQDLSAPVLT
jgi:hypothetical protein